MTMPSKGQVFEYWKERIFEKGFFIDWGEPSCWACGESWNGRYDIKNPNASHEKILNAWEKAPLQRCHIVPASLGGTDDESNLFLMCKQCHDLAPNTSFPEIFFQWARNQSNIKRFNQEMQECLEIFNISKELCSELIDISKTEKYKAWSDIHGGIHRPQSGYSGTGKKLTVSTFMGLLLYYYNNEYRQTYIREHQT